MKKIQVLLLSIKLMANPLITIVDNINDVLNNFIYVGIVIIVLMVLVYYKISKS
ncbi:hypothetical protein AVBRAN12642_07065 [Campylobacter sp. RM12642]|uniref:hypothetical protein n=1 Tax=unclassified Campylobacter TaxID=2593542 RepID=UPI001D7A068A|nr:hypothetical protein [Campylobacter sp. RM12642]MBZ8008356.1 hypothetical protein [Campylobacter sp. RM9334]